MGGCTTHFPSFTIPAHDFWGCWVVDKLYWVEMHNFEWWASTQLLQFEAEFETGSNLSICATSMGFWEVQKSVPWPVPQVNLWQNPWHSLVRWLFDHHDYQLDHFQIPIERSQFANSLAWFNSASEMFACSTLILVFICRLWTVDQNDAWVRQAAIMSDL